MEKTPRPIEATFCHRLRSYTCHCFSTVSIPHYCDLLVPDDSIDSPASETEESEPVKHPPPCKNPKHTCTQPKR